MVNTGMALVVAGLLQENIETPWRDHHRRRNITYISIAGELVVVNLDHSEAYAAAVVVNVVEKNLERHPIARLDVLRHHWQT